MKCTIKDLKLEVCQKCDHSTDGHKKNKYCRSGCVLTGNIVHTCVKN